MRQQTTESEDEEPTRRPSVLLRLPALGPTLAPTYPGVSTYPLELLVVDVKVFTLGLGAAYRFNPYVTFFGGYSFLIQRVGRFSTTQDFDADQNRVKLGVQFGYPFAFDLGS